MRRVIVAFAAFGLVETTDYGGGFVAAENFATEVLPNTCP